MHIEGSRMAILCSRRLAGSGNGFAMIVKLSRSASRLVLRLLAMRWKYRPNEAVFQKWLARVTRSYIPVGDCSLERKRLHGLRQKRSSANVTSKRQLTGIWLLTMSV